MRFRRKKGQPALRKPTWRVCREVDGSRVTIYVATDGYNPRYPTLTGRFRCNIGTYDHVDQERLSEAVAKAVRKCEELEDTLAYVDNAIAAVS